MLDPAFLRPIAHRGLHRLALARVENTAPAFTAAIEAGFGIECDLRPGSGSVPLVFHDATLDRLTTGTGPVAALGAPDLRQVRHRVGGSAILTFGELLGLVAGRTPLLVEIKSEWQPPDVAFLGEIIRLCSAYAGPLALMSFDPAVMAVVRERAPDIPRGIVSGSYASGGDWWPDALDADRRTRLRDLLESRPAAPDFYAYEVDALPTPVTRFVHEVMSVPLLTWTVRTAEQKARAARWADAAIFEDV